MPIQPINEILLELAKPLQDEIITEGGLKLYKDTRFHPEWNTTITGKIAALPAKHKDFNDKVKDAEELVFSYGVVADREFGADGHYFQPETEGSEYFQKYSNPKGEKLAIVAMPKVISIQWAGYYLDKSGELIDGCVGDEHAISRWKSQFSFGHASDIKFKNLLEWDGVDYWRCRIDDVFAKKVGNELIPVGDRLILEPIVINLKDKMEIVNGKALPFQRLTFIPSDRAILTHDCEELGLSKGDVVSFDDRFCEKYEIYGKNYFLIKHARAKGVWQIAA